MNILIPMAGRGQRFKNAGYKLPKPLINVDGKPMIQRVVENFLPLKGIDQFIFLILQEHIDQYPEMVNLLYSITNGKCQIVPVKEVTEGAACTALLASKFINNETPLLIVNSDQIVDFNVENFETLRQTLTMLNNGNIIFTFYDDNPKWSFVRLSKYDNTIQEIAEKQPISNIATCGIYYWSSGLDFILAANRMISANDRYNNEFYIAPCFNINYTSEDTWPYFVNKMHGLGTPEDLEKYLGTI